VLVVDCDESVQISRVMARSGLAADAVKAIMATQASRAERRAVADDVVLNEGGLEALLPQVEGLHLRYLDLARAKPHAGR
jgi:dephospho-CoA kinase